MIIVGSHALNFWAELFNLENTKRTPRDIDLIGTFDEIQALGKSGVFTQFYPVNSGKGFYGRTKNGTHVEMEIAWEGTSGEVILRTASGSPTMTTEVGEYRVANSRWLYLLKLSHRYLKDSPHFHKTMKDIWDIRKDYPAHTTWKDDSNFQKVLKHREAETYTYAHPKLNQGKDSFFTESGELKYKYCHDSIHEAVATLSQPAYKLFSKDGEEVAMDKAKWAAMSHYEQLLTVLEEAYVLAIERSIVPFDTEPRKAFNMALMKITSSISSGWWREFGWEHYYEVEKLYDEKFIDKFKAAVDNGVVKSFTGSKY